MFDCEALLEPISADSPTGENLREQPSDLTFQNVTECRTEVPPEDDPAGEGREFNWTLANRHCQEALQEKSKDLDLASYLTEAMVHQVGFEGLRDGLHLTNELIERFWDRLHPGLEDDGEIIFPIRGRPLTWLGTSQDFLRAVQSAPLVKCGDGRDLCWSDFTSTEMVDERRAQVGEEAYKELIDAGYLSGEEWNTRFASANVESLRHSLAMIGESETELRTLRAHCESKFEEDEPNFVALGELLMDVREYLESRIPEDAGPVVEEGTPGDEAVAGAAPHAAAGPGATAGPIGSRSDALRRLSEVADYFQRVEPHSPIAYLIQRTVRWGEMPLENLLEELVKDDTVLERIWETLGITRAGTEGGG